MDRQQSGDQGTHVGNRWSLLGLREESGEQRALAGSGQEAEGPV